MNAVKIFNVIKKSVKQLKGKKSIAILLWDI